MSGKVGEGQWLFAAGTVALSVIFAWLSRCTRSIVLPVMVLHTAVHAWAGIIPILPAHGVVRPYALLTALMVGVATVLLAVGQPGDTSEQVGGHAGRGIPARLT